MYVLEEEDLEYEYYCVKVVRSKRTGFRLVEEWFHDPNPRDGLRLHRSEEPARMEFDPATGKEKSSQYYDMGELMMTVGPPGSSFPEPGQ